MTSPFAPIPTGLVFALFGLMVGSFLNVCIYRLPRRESIVFPASHCTACGKPIPWYHNLPVVSWLLLRGRCASCGERISIVYPLVELLTGIIFFLHYYWLGASLLLIPRLIFACGLIVLAFIDLRHRILPNPITIGGTVLGFLFSFVLAPGWLSSLIGILIGGGLLFVVGEIYLRLRGLEGMGMGDVKMLAMIGAFLGWKGVLVTLVLSSMTGALVGLILLVSQKGDMKSQLPFGTFLAASALVASLFGDALANWYLSLALV